MISVRGRADASVPGRTARIREAAVNGRVRPGRRHWALRAGRPHRVGALAVPDREAAEGGAC
jgi:hypothetical protein